MGLGGEAEAGPLFVSLQGVEREVVGAPAPTFLHQLLVDERAAHDQQHSQEHQGQDDAQHGACAQARRVWILAWGGRGGRWVHPSVSDLSYREAAGWLPPVTHWHA